jgi:hypothetical protein
MQEPFKVPHMSVGLQHQLPCLFEHVCELGAMHDGWTVAAAESGLPVRFTDSTWNGNFMTFSKKCGKKTDSFEPRRSVVPLQRISSKMKKIELIDRKFRRKDA